MLRKLPERVVTPGKPGVPGTPEYTVCEPIAPGNPGGGSWQTVCRDVVLPPNTAVPVPPGGSVTIISVSPAGLVVRICASEWVP